MAPPQQTVNAFWWRPLAGSWRQRALDFRHLWIRDRAGRLLPPWGWNNFGDELTPFLLARTAPSVIVRHSNLKNADVVLVGSVLQRFDEQVGSPMVLGSGLSAILSHEKTAAVSRNLGRCNVRGVRGPLTARALGLDRKMILGDTALALAGDPALAQTSPRTSGLIVAHFSAGKRTQTRNAVLSVAQRLGAAVAFSCERPTEVMQRIANARWVISTSLHGLILADIAGIPAVGATLRHRQSFDFRFADYAAAVGREETAQIPLGKVSLVEVDASLDRSFVDVGRIRDMGYAVASELASWANDL